jgi:hypothetical protein
MPATTSIHATYSLVKHIMSLHPESIVLTTDYTDNLYAHYKDTSYLLGAMAVKVDATTIEYYSIICPATLLAVEPILVLFGYTPALLTLDELLHRPEIKPIDLWASCLAKTPLLDIPDFSVDSDLLMVKEGSNNVYTVLYSPVDGWELYKLDLIHNWILACVAGDCVNLSEDRETLMLVTSITDELDVTLRNFHQFMSTTPYAPYRDLVAASWNAYFNSMASSMASNLLVKAFIHKHKNPALVCNAEFQRAADNSLDVTLMVMQDGSPYIAEIVVPTDDQELATPVQVMLHPLDYCKVTTVLNPPALFRKSMEILQSYDAEDGITDEVEDNVVADIIFGTLEKLGHSTDSLLTFNKLFHGILPSLVEAYNLDNPQRSINTPLVNTGIGPLSSYVLETVPLSDVVGIPAVLHSVVESAFFILYENEFYWLSPAKATDTATSGDLYLYRLSMDDGLLRHDLRYAPSFVSKEVKHKAALVTKISQDFEPLVNLSMFGLNFELSEGTPVDVPFYNEAIEPITMHLAKVLNSSPSVRVVH